MSDAENAPAAAPEENAPKDEMAPEEAAKEEEAAPEEQPLVAAAEKPAEEVASTKAGDDDIDENEYCPCCCCHCFCSEAKYRDLTCCGCFPIRCGIYLIGFFAILLLVVMFSNAFMFLLSETVAWWYVAASVCLQIPSIIGVIFFLNWFGGDSDASRGKLDPACMLAIISYSLQGIWNIIYFNGLYKLNNITLGNEDAGW